VIDANAVVEMHELETVCGGGAHSGTPPLNTVTSNHQRASISFAVKNYDILWWAAFRVNGIWPVYAGGP
jgi:hypothetical protein